jgi:hypothetical protein
MDAFTTRRIQPGGRPRRFYNGQHQHWCGIGPHARTVYVCILDSQGEVLVVVAECIFTWHWLADLCAREEMAFVLGHGLQIAMFLCGGMLPQAYSYPASMRATRDLLRRRLHLLREREQLLAHIQTTAQQDGLPPLGKRIACPVNRVGVAEHCEERG